MISYWRKNRKVKAKNDELLAQKSKGLILQGQSENDELLAQKSQGLSEKNELLTE